MASRSATMTPQGYLQAQSRWHPLEIAFWLATLLPFVLFPDYLSLASQIAITALFALSLDIILGYAGIVSLGHAAFFGIGAYSAGLLSKYGWGEPLTGLVVATAVAGLVGFVISFVIARFRHFTLIMLFVTHSIEEAMIVGSRILILTPHPGRVRAELDTSMFDFSNIDAPEFGAMDRIAAAGLRYTNFHSTSLCSPTRAAIITGRNHHSVGNGVVGEIATGFPGYDSIIPIEKGTIGTILKANGYATSWPTTSLEPTPARQAARN